MNNNWIYKKIGEVATFSRGLTFSKADVASVSSKKVLRSNNIDLNSHSLNFDDVTCLKEGFIIPDEKKLHKGDIFICMSNGSTQHLGKVAFIEVDMDYAFGGFMGAIHPDVKNVYPKFAFYSCLSTEYRRFLASILNGVNINNLKWSELSKFTIPVPPIETQSRIVSELDLLQSIIDKQKAQLKELDNLAQAVFYDMFGDNNCTKKRLGEVVKVQSGLVSPLEAPYCDMIHIGPANIESHTGKLVDLKTAKEEKLISGKYLFDPSMVLYSKIRPNLNKVTIASFEGICSADMYPLKPTKELDKRFLLFILKQTDFLDYAVSNSGRANIPKINREALLNYKIVLPPLSLQQSFAAKIESIEKQKAAINQSIAETQRLFDFTMDKYFG